LEKLEIKEIKRQTSSFGILKNKKMKPGGGVIFKTNIRKAVGKKFLKLKKMKKPPKNLLVFFKKENKAIKRKKIKILLLEFNKHTQKGKKKK
jgi:hypothetical protein